MAHNSNSELVKRKQVQINAWTALKGMFIADSKTTEVKAEAIIKSFANSIFLEAEYMDSLNCQSDIVVRVSRLISWQNATDKACDFSKPLMVKDISLFSGNAAAGSINFAESAVVKRLPFCVYVECKENAWKETIEHGLGYPLPEEKFAGFRERFIELTSDDAKELPVYMGMLDASGEIATQLANASLLKLLSGARTIRDAGFIIGQNVDEYLPRLSEEVVNNYYYCKVAEQILVCLPTAPNFPMRDFEHVRTDEKIRKCVQEIMFGYAEGKENDSSFDWLNEKIATLLDEALTKEAFDEKVASFYEAIKLLMNKGYSTEEIFFMLATEPPVNWPTVGNAMPENLPG